MEIEKSSTLGEITIKGQIQSFSDYERIKEALNEQIEDGARSLSVRIPDSKTIISSVVGVFMKIVNYNKLPLHLYIKEETLFKIMDNLGLVDVMNIKKI